LEIEFTLRKTDREWIPVEIKPSKPEVPGSNPGRRTTSFCKASQQKLLINY